MPRRLRVVAAEAAEPVVLLRPAPQQVERQPWATAWRAVVAWEVAASLLASAAVEAAVA